MLKLLLALRDVLLKYQTQDLLIVIILLKRTRKILPCRRFFVGREFGVRREVAIDEVLRVLQIESLFLPHLLDRGDLVPLVEMGDRRDGGLRLPVFRAFHRFILRGSGADRIGHEQRWQGCGPCWTRTNDSLLKRQVLYRLS